MTQTTIKRLSDYRLLVTGATCRCGGRLAIRDHGERGDFRYELHCMSCHTRDRGGYRLLRDVRAALSRNCMGGRT